MRNEVLLRTPYRKGARLNLVPRLRPDETLSSWLERLAGRYAMNPLGLLQWMGYPCTRSPSHPVGSRGVGRLDLDIEPPLDLPRTLAHHCGTSAKERFGCQHTALCGNHTDARSAPAAGRRTVRTVAVSGRAAGR